MADTTTTTTTSPTTPTSVHSAATDLTGLFHAQHTALIVYHAPYLTLLTLHLPANAAASAVARIQHVAPPFFKTTEHRKRHRACRRCRRLPASSCIRKTARGKLTAASSGKSSSSAPFAPRGTSVLSAVLDHQAATDTSLPIVWHGAFFSFFRVMRI